MPPPRLWCNFACICCFSLIEYLISGYRLEFLSSLSVRQDDVAAIVNHLEQMVNYILEECAAKGPFGPGGTITGPPSSVSTLSSSTSSSAPSPAPSLNSYAISPILDYILDNYVLEKVLDWSLQTAEFTLRLLEEQLRIFEVSWRYYGGSWAL